MTPKVKPLVLAMFTLMCAIIPAAGAIPSVNAQEDTSLGQDLAGGIVSDVLDGGGDDEEENGDADDAETDDQDSTDTATVNPNQEDNNEANFAPQNNNPVAIPIINQDQGAANLAAQLAANLDLDAVNVDVNEEETTEPICPEGFAPENGQCRSTETTVDRECPDDFEFETREGGEVVCESTVTTAEECPDGFEAETVGTEEVCGSTETTVDRECPDGFEAETVGTEEVCGSTETTVDRECPDGFAFDTVNGEQVCRSTATTAPNCGGGHTYDAARDACVNTQTGNVSPSRDPCPGANDALQNDMCRSTLTTVDRECPDDFEFETREGGEVVCESTLTTVDRECPDDFEAETVGTEEVCGSTETTVDRECPDGFAFDTVNGEQVCRSTATTEPI